MQKLTKLEQQTEQDFLTTLSFKNNCSRKHLFEISGFVDLLFSTLNSIWKCDVARVPLWCVGWRLTAIYSEAFYLTKEKRR